MQARIWFVLFYNSLLGEGIRFLIVAALAFFLVLGVFQGTFPKLTIFFMLWFGMFEIFFHFKLDRYKPLLSVSQNNGQDVLGSLSYEAIKHVVAHTKTHALLNSLMDTAHVRFLLEKIGTLQKEIPLVAIPQQTLLQKALFLSRKRCGTYITTFDIVASYLLLSEEQTKLLFAKKIKEDDIVRILGWTATQFPLEEEQSETAMFFGEGIGESWVYGWTLETGKYALDITNRALQKEPVLLGREEEYTALLTSLSTSEQKNVVLVGEGGSGRSTLVYFLAYQCYLGRVPAFLYHRRIYEILLARLLAGTKEMGDLETRLEAVLTEIAHSGNMILYVPEFQNILGASTFQLDLSGVLLPYLQNGSIPVIGTMTPGNFAKYLEQSPIRNLFHVIDLASLDQETVIQILMKKSQQIQKDQEITISYSAVVTAASLARRYLQDEAIPSSAIKLLADSASNAKLQGKTLLINEDVVSKAEQETHVPLATPSTQEKDLLLHLEEKLHERVVAQDEAVSVIAQAMRRVRTGMVTQTKPISFLFLGPTGVGKTETAKALAALYFGAEEHMIRLDMSEYATNVSIDRLLGSTANLGSERDSFVDHVHKTPFSLILLDEFEKASEGVRNLFLQVLDDGRLTDTSGRTISFLNTIIIATSNAGSEFIREAIEKGRATDATFTHELLELLQSQHIFPPELLNRFDGVVVFKPLSDYDAEKIVKLILQQLAEKLAKQDITVSFDQGVVQKIVSDGIDKQFGARPLRRYIQNAIEDIIARDLLGGTINRGSKILVSVDGTNTIVIVIKE